MTEWKYDNGDVLIDENGYWWHVQERYKCVDTGRRMYHLWDGTHTADDMLAAEWLERKKDTTFAGWNTDTKPAYENGFRVNGILSEPANVDRWKGNECVSDFDCENCGETTRGNADHIVNHAKKEVAGAWIECNECGQKTIIDV